MDVKETVRKSPQELAFDVLAFVAKRPELQAFWASLPPVAPVSGYEEVQDTWLRLLGHLPTYDLGRELATLIEDALPAVVQSLVTCVRDNT
jgi:hypothetical protein